MGKSLAAYFRSKLVGLNRKLYRVARRLHHRPKYYLSVYAIMHNESHILREWIEIHLNEGIEHFFLVDHGSTDNWREKIADYVQNNTITIIELHSNDGGLDNLRAENSSLALAQSEWLLIQDLDEFTYATGRQCITDFLKSVPNDVHQIAVPWVLFGTGGNIEQPNSIVKACVRAEDMVARANLINSERPWHAKSIVRSRHLDLMHVHIHGVAGRTILPLSDIVEVEGHFFIDNKYAARLSDFQILQNHYIHQSHEFYQAKMKRKGYILEVSGKGKSYSDERFIREESIINAVENKKLMAKYFNKIENT